jgi:hypothetical protein
LKAGTSAGRKLVLLFFLAGLTVSVGWTAAKSLRRIQKAFLYAGESALAERSREFGAPYARKVEEIRGLIPQDGVYGLVDALGAFRSGAAAGGLPGSAQRPSRQPRGAAPPPPARRALGGDRP